MAAAGVIDELLSDSAKQDITWLLQNIKGVKEEYISLSNEVKSKELNLTGKLNVKGLDTDIANLQKSVAALTDGIAKYAEAAANATAAKVKLSDNTRKEQKDNEYLTNDYKQLVQAYNEARTRALNYALVQGINSKATQQQISDATKLRDAISHVEAAVNLTSKTTSGYNPVVAQFNQLLRELPNAAQSTQIFVMSLGNNLSYFFEAMKKSREEGKTWGVIMKDVGSNLFGFVGVLNLAVLTLENYTNWVKTNGSAASIAERANQKFADSIKSINDNALSGAASEISQLKALSAIIEDETASREKKLQASREIIKLAPELQNSYTIEEIASGKAKDKLDEYTHAIMQNAIAKAASDKYGAAYLRQVEAGNAVIKALQEQKKAQDEAADAEARFVRNANAKDRGLVQTYENVMILAKRRAEAAKDNVEELRKEHDAAIRVSLGYQEIAKKALESAPDILGGGKAKTSKGTDLTKETISAKQRGIQALSELDKVQLEDDINTQELIYKNQDQSQQARLNALSKWLNDKLALNEQGLKSEIEQNKVALDKIAEIEGKDPSKRTAQEKKLLVDKEAYLAEGAALRSKYTIYENKIIADAIREQGIIIKQGSDAENQYRLDSVNNIMLNNQKQYEAEETALIQSLQKREISYAEYQRKVKQLQDQYAKTGIDSVIDYLQEILDHETLTADQRRVIQEQLDKARLQSSKLTNKQILDDEAAALAKRIQIYEAIRSAVNTVTNSLLNIAKNRTDKEVNELENQKVAYDKDADHRKQIIENSLLDDKEKSQKEADIDALNEARKNQIQQDEAQRQQRLANFQIGMAILKATLSLYLGISEEIAKGGAIGIVTGAAVAGYMATIISAIASTRTPAYKTGRNGGKAEFALVNEEGPELIGGGNSWRIANGGKKGITYLEQGESVIPNHKFKAMAENAGVDVNSLSVNGGGGADMNIISAMLGVGTAVSTAIRNLPVTQVSWKNGDAQFITKRGNNRIIKNKSNL